MPKLLDFADSLPLHCNTPDTAAKATPPSARRMNYVDIRQTAIRGDLSSIR